MTSFRSTMQSCVIASTLLGCGSEPATCGMPFEPVQASDNMSCTAMLSCPHAGGDSIHNKCADRVPPNVAWPAGIGMPPGTEGEGCDVKLAGKKFDALSWDSKKQNPTLWETKTAALSDPIKYNAFTAKCESDSDINDFIDECTRVIACNVKLQDPNRLHYVMAIADQKLYTNVNYYFKQQNNLKALTLPAGTTLADFMNYCTTSNEQSCRR